MQNDITIDNVKIQTYRSDHAEPPYIAVNISIAHAMLDGYELEEKEKSSLAHLMAGYCRLIDEANLIGYGKTEFEAIQDMFARTYIASYRH